jgi:hypothetical protein
MHNRNLYARFLVILVILVQALSACNFPGMGAAPTVDQTAIALQVVQTINALSLSATVPPSATLLPTETLSPPTEAIPNTEAIPPTETITPTPTEVQPSVTPIPTEGPPTITASVDTRCRSGPSPVYPVIGYILVGQQSNVYGRLGDNSWWYIENPKKPGQFCWAWGETTQVVGNINLIPVLTPPPTPTPSISLVLSFAEFHICSGDLTAILQVTNNGSETIKSINLTIKATSGSTIYYGPATTNAPFGGGSGMCPPGANFLDPGNTGYFGGVIGPMVSGAKLQALVTLCTEKNLNGGCVDLSVKFTVP